MKNFLAIKLDNVSKGFEGKTVIDQITCEFKNKEVHVILGKSGTGKSVLLKMIMGLFKPELGRILIDNKDLNTQGSNEVEPQYFDFSSFQIFSYVASYCNCRLI